MSGLAREGEVVATADGEAARRAGRQGALRLALAAGAAVALGLLVDATYGPVDVEAARRSWSSPRADGFRVCAELAGRLGHRVARQRSAWGELPDPARHALVVVDPLPITTVRGPRAEVDPSQVRALARWVHGGGHLVLAPAGRRRLSVGDLPWSDDVDDLTPAIVDALGLTLPGPAIVPAAASLTADPPLALAPGALAPLGSHDELLAAAWLTWSGRPLALGVARRGQAELPAFAEAEVVDAPDAVAAPRLVPRVRLADVPFVLEATHGAGRVWLVASAYPFTGAALARGGAGPLVAGLLHEATEGGRRGLVLDQRAHGLTARRGLAGPLSRAGLGTPLVAVLGVVALLAWRGGVREGPARPARGAPRRAKEEFVVALGDLARRAGHHRAAAGWLVEAWRERLPVGADAQELEQAIARARAARDDDALARAAEELREAVARAAQQTVTRRST